MREGDVAFPQTADAVLPAQIRVNGTDQPWSAGLTLEALLDRQGEDGAGVATAVNGNFVPRGERGATVLAAGDSVLVFGAIVGG